MGFPDRQEGVLAVTTQPSPLSALQANGHPRPWCGPQSWATQHTAPRDEQRLRGRGKHVFPTRQS